MACILPAIAGLARGGGGGGGGGSGEGVDSAHHVITKCGTDPLENTLLHVDRSKQGPFISP